MFEYHPVLTLLQPLVTKTTEGAQCKKYLLYKLFTQHVSSRSNKEYEQVKSFKYLGAIVNTDNTMEEEIKERIALGNKAYFANKKMFQSKIITKRAKLKLYHMINRPIVTYACEAWILKDTIINKLLVFERKILRKIFGPINKKGIWRIKNYQDLDEIIKHKNIINFI